LCDELRVVLHPEHVVLARLKRELTHRGVKRCVQSVSDIACEPAADAALPWEPALKALASGLAAQSAAHANVTVILSNHFMRYALVPWSDALSDESEERVFAQHTFDELYGRDENRWDLRISSGRSGMPQLASAVDERLTTALRGVLAQPGCRLRSIQPHLMLAYNACYPELRGKSAWLAVVEQGSLCLALLQQGLWSWVRMMRIDGGQELPLLLNREAHLASCESGVDEVLLWTPEQAEATDTAEGRWKFRQLQPLFLPSCSADVDDRFAMYLSE
jgi:hypothetical protein